MKKNISYIVASLLLCGLVASCSKPAANTEPQVIASFWRKVTPADSLMEGFRVMEAEGQTRYIVPITEWTASPEVDTYHQLHHHGVALESDLMAYRIYFDRKQTIDVYAKKTPRLELPTSYWYPTDEQLADHYGDDVLRVSGTIGVGSVKPWRDGKMRHIEPVESRTQRIVYQTNDSAAMEVSVKGWQTEGKTVDMTVRYTLRAHHRDMRCEVFLSEPLDSLCTGVQQVPFKNPDLCPGSFIFADASYHKGTVLGSWGTDWPVNDTVKYTKETVGLGVFIPKEYATESALAQTPNLVCLFRPATYLCFYLTCVAQKEDNPPARNAEEFRDFLFQWANGL
ncbi:MAG: DUF4861 family protein [Paludibacteraceae bacterium]|nr:DUF4861 family protein [Paludibacteraceae bacterium]